MVAGPAPPAAAAAPACPRGPKGPGPVRQSPRRALGEKGPGRRRRSCPRPCRFSCGLRAPYRSSASCPPRPPTCRSGRGPVRCRLPAESRRSEEHTSELQSLTNLVCRLLLEKKKKKESKKRQLLKSTD